MPSGSWMSCVRDLDVDVLGARAGRRDDLELQRPGPALDVEACAGSVAAGSMSSVPRRQRARRAARRERSARATARSTRHTCGPSARSVLPSPARASVAPAPRTVAPHRITGKRQPPRCSGHWRAARAAHDRRPAPGYPAPMDPERRLDAYVPRVLLRHLAEAPGLARHERRRDGGLRRHLRLHRSSPSGSRARAGKAPKSSPRRSAARSSALLTVAYANGGSLLKLGGDALLLLFEHEGHAERACQAAAGMRATLRQIGRLTTGAGQVTLRISQGVHSGTFHLFLVGDSHREQLLAGPAASTVVRMEKAADAGEIVISPQTAALLPSRCAGAQRGPGCCWRAHAQDAGAHVEPDYERPPLEARRRVPADDGARARLRGRPAVRASQRHRRVPALLRHRRR